MTINTDAEYAAITEAQEMEQEALFAKQNVVGVATGHKIKEGRDIGDLCVTILVSQKLDKALLKAGDEIPTSIKGFKTDVVETGEIFVSDGEKVAMKDELGIEVLRQRVRPAKGGSA
jgi:hypothetical protein